MSALPFLRRRRERRAAERKRFTGRLTTGVISIGLFFVLVLWLTIMGASMVYASITSGLPPIGQLEQLLDPRGGILLQPTRIYDRTGAHLLQVLADRDAARKYISVDPAVEGHLPDTLVRATTALLDPQFQSHSGCQWTDIIAPGQNRTIAQRLVADLLLWNEPPGLRRSIRECLLASQITSVYGRQKVMEWYLNIANFGHFAYGADAASRLYFGKPVDQLNLAEAALLASVNQSPAINPLDSPQASIQRAQDALEEILRRGQASSEEVALARYMPLVFMTPARPEKFAPTFLALALSQLENNYSRTRVELGGMVVYTTLDVELQRRAECAVQTQFAHLRGAVLPYCDGSTLLPPLAPGQAAPQAAASAAVLDPRTGQVLALVGDSSSGFESAFLTPHRPGTLLAPFVYLAGFTRGLSPASLVWDIPSTDEGVTTRGFAGKGPMRVRTASASDARAPLQQVFNDMGANLVRQTMLPFGLDVSAINSNDLLETQNRYSVLQMAHFYSVFASQGVLYGQPARQGLEPSAIISVKSLDGISFVDMSVPFSEQVVSGQLSYLVTDMLSGAQASLGGLVAMKSGTTADGLDNWFLGYTPQRVVAVWMGGKDLSQRTVQGLWTAVMHSASLNIPPVGWALPAGIQRIKVCDPSGMLPTRDCPNQVDEVFIEGNQPVQTDTLYRSYEINTETGLLATVYTPDYLVQKRVYMVIPPIASAWAKNAGLPEPPTQYDVLQPPVPDQNVVITSPAMFAAARGSLKITGTAAGDGFSYYRLEYGRGLNPDNWVQIGSNMQTPVSNGLLGEWDTTDLRGLYALQLLVVRKDGTAQKSIVMVELNSPGN